MKHAKQIGKQEKRAIRREYINHSLRTGWNTLSLIKQQVRLEERFHFGAQLRIYGVRRVS